MNPKVICLSLIFASLLAFNSTIAQSREVLLFNWLGGSEKEMFDALEAGFEADNPNIDIVQINPASTGDDQRAGIRTALLAGEQFDILINTWPSLEKEMVANNLLLPLDEAWEEYGWSDALSDSWKNLSSHDGQTYGAYIIAGSRSGMWYRVDNLASLGLEPPQNFDEFLASFEVFRAAGKTPVYIGARSWAQTEWFENALLRTAGTDFARRLANHEVPWTSGEVRETLRNLRKMLEAGCCSDADTMLSTHWSDGSDSAVSEGSSGYVLIGTWLNSRAQNEYGLEPGRDFNFVNFPTITPAHADALSVDGKDLVVMRNGNNPEDAMRFIDFVLSAEGTAIMAEYGQASPSRHSNPSLYDPVVASYTRSLLTSDVFFVLDDLLPAELSGEFRIGLQSFLRDPSDESIAAITERWEAVAQDVY